MARIDDCCPALKELKISELAIARLVRKQKDCSSQEEHFAINKQIRIYKQGMVQHAKRLAEQLQKLLDSDKDYYINYATSPHEKMMQEYIKHEPEGQK